MLKEIFNSDVWKFIQRDALYIILIMFALMACILTLRDVKKFEVECNNNYLNYIESNCRCGFEEEPEHYIIDTSRYDWIVNMTGGYNNGSNK